MIQRRKHYSRADNITADFTSRLPSDVTLTGTPTMTTLRADYGTTADLIVGACTISGNKVLGPVPAGGTAGGGTAGNLQEDGEYNTKYVIRVLAPLSNGKTDSVLIELVNYDCVERTS